MNSNVTISYARLLRLLFVGVSGVALLLALATLHQIGYATLRQVNGISLIVTEHLQTTQSLTRSDLILDCSLKSGPPLSIPNQGNEGFSPDMRVNGVCRIVENPVTNGAATPAPKSYSDPDNSVTLPKSSPDLKTHSSPSKEKSSMPRS